MTYIKFETIDQITIPESGDVQTLLWWNQPDSEEKIRFLNNEARDGHCYLRMMLYYCDFATLPLEEFFACVLNFKEQCGAYPDSVFCVNEVNLLWFTTFVERITLPTPEQFEKLMERVRKSKIRLEVQVRNGVIHVEKIGSRPMCECMGPVCRHGWNHRMATVTFGSMNRRIGASNFDMMEFMQGAMLGDEEDFEEAYTQIQPEESDIKASKKIVENWNQDVRASSQEQEIGNQTSIAEAKTELQLLKEEVEKLKTQNQTRQPLSPPMSPEPLRRKAPTIASLEPNDSSSVYSRYGRRFMEEGTVLVPQSSLSRADQIEHRTNLTVSNSLVEGFKKTQELEEDERQVLRRLRPINGLPRPFADSRLNFLANIHTAIYRARSKRPDSCVTAMYYALRSRPELPVDDLLHQVLAVTIDRSSGVFISNAFSLPYIEIGMHVTEEAVVKVFDLLYNEYKCKWFQELKNIIVPDFHNAYRTYSMEAMPHTSRRREHKENPQVKRSKSKGKGGRSILGF